MKNSKVEKDFIIDGYRCVIIGSYMGHRCGYIAIPKEHKLYKESHDYNDLDIDIHGGWTYSSTTCRAYPVVTDEDTYWIGFDCGHYGDGKDIELIKSFGEQEERTKILLNMECSYPTGEEIRTIEYVENQLKNAVEQLKKLV